MTVKEQFAKLKNNWLLILLPLVLIFAVMGGFSGLSLLAGDFSASSDSVGGYERPSPMMYAESGSYESASYAKAPSAISSLPASDASDVAAPEIKDQMIAKTASMETKVERGTFLDEEARLKAIITASDAIMLWQNVEAYGEGMAQYQVGRYQIKIDSKKYDAIVSQLKGIGKVESFKENSEDVTQTYTDLNIELEGEKKRLERYEQMYKEATLIEDKIDISDRIFNQENYIKYLEESLKNVGEQVVYSTLDVTITETKSGYAELTFIKPSDLAKALVGSVSGLIYLFIVLLPWALGLWLVVVVVRKIRGKKTAISKK